MNAKLKEWDLDNPEDESQYNDMLNDCYGDVNICGLEYSASLACKMVDPIAYRCGFNDWSDSQEEKWECTKCYEWYNNEEEARECCLCTICNQKEDADGNCGCNN